MIPANSYIVLQSYGSEGILQECAFALLTLTRQHTAEELSNLEIWIYTDKPEWFKRFNNCPLNLKFGEINPAILERWRGAIDFVHRVKIEMLRDFVKGKEGQVLYLDTDVYFYRSASEMFGQIEKGELYMHIMEGLIHESGNVILGKLSAFIRKNIPLRLKGNIVEIPSGTAMWNAGVLGFHTRYSYLLDEVMLFTDEIYNQFPKHVVEQFAFSYYFQRTSSIKTASVYIYHYWNLKEIRAIYASFFEYFKDQSWEETAFYSQLIQLPVPMQEKVNFLQNRTPVAKFMKEHWKPEMPRWDLLIQQL